MIFVCAYCKKEFERKKSSNAKYCCQECQNKNIRLARFKKHILENGDIVNGNEYTARRVA